jgi:cation-transporting P-type ATPase 13A2
MCGDGANDCGALKTADIGVSLSEAEASIAAPFTSQIQDISSVVIVLREGRCALTTSFQMFKFIELYSMIQFISVTFLYTIGSNLGDNQFLYIDLALLVPLSMFMGQTEPYRHLTPHLPSGALISLPVLASVIGSILIQFGFQAFMFFFVTWWTFYKEHPDDPYEQPTFDPAVADDNTQCLKNTSMFLISLFQYVVVCVAFSISKPFR